GKRKVHRRVIRAALTWPAVARFNPPPARWRTLTALVPTSERDDLGAKVTRCRVGGLADGGVTRHTPGVDYGERPHGRRGASGRRHLMSVPDLPPDDDGTTPEPGPTQRDWAAGYRDGVAGQGTRHAERPSSYPAGYSGWSTGSEAPDEASARPDDLPRRDTPTRPGDLPRRGDPPRAGDLARRDDLTRYDPTAGYDALARHDDPLAGPE